jgi:hypothetical protein
VTDWVFVFFGSGIFKAGNPAERAAAIVKATTFYDDPDVIAKVSRDLGEAMVMKPNYLLLTPFTAPLPSSLPGRDIRPGTGRQPKCWLMTSRG